jgi:hypothetical protein
MCCLYFLAADLLWAGPFSRWSLISTAALWATSYVFIQIELDFDWVERQIIKDRYDAVAHTFNVKDGSAVEEASEHAKSRSSTKLYSKPILLARLSLAAICFAGVYFSPRFAVRHVRRLGGMLVAEVALRACCEILFNKSSLSRWSSWKDTLESLQDFSVTVGDKLIEEKRQARDTGEMPPFAKRVAWVLGAFWAS